MYSSACSNTKVIRRYDTIMWNACVPLKVSLKKLPKAECRETGVSARPRDIAAHCPVSDIAAFIPADSFIPGPREVYHLSSSFHQIPQIMP